MLTVSFAKKKSEVQDIHMLSFFISVTFILYHTVRVKGLFLLLHWGSGDHFRKLQIDFTQVE